MQFSSQRTNRARCCCYQEEEYDLQPVLECPVKLIPGRRLANSPCRYPPQGCLEQIFGRDFNQRKCRCCCHHETFNWQVQSRSNEGEADDELTRVHALIRNRQQPQRPRREELEPLVTIKGPPECCDRSSSSHTGGKSYVTCDGLNGIGLDSATTSKDVTGCSCKTSGVSTFNLEPAVSTGVSNRVLDFIPSKDVASVSARGKQQPLFLEKIEPGSTSTEAKGLVQAKNAAAKAEPTSPSSLRNGQSQLQQREPNSALTRRSYASAKLEDSTVQSKRQSLKKPAKKQIQLDGSEADQSEKGSQRSVDYVSRSSEDSSSMLSEIMGNGEEDYCRELRISSALIILALFFALAIYMNNFVAKL